MADEIEATGYQRDAAAQKKFDAAMKPMDMGDFKKAYSAFKKYVEEFPMMLRAGTVRPSAATMHPECSEPR